MKKLLTTLVIGYMVLANAPAVMADTTKEKETCSTNQYGETTCTKTTETTKEVVVHEPVDTALGDMNPMVISVMGLTLAGGLFYLSIRTKRVFWLDR